MGAVARAAPGALVAASFALAALAGRGSPCAQSSLPSKRPFGAFRAIGALGALGALGAATSGTTVGIVTVVRLTLEGGRLRAGAARVSCAWRSSETLSPPPPPPPPPPLPAATSAAGSADALRRCIGCPPGTAFDAASDSRSDATPREPTHAVGVVAF